jgi:hypothetical protein
MVLAGYYDIPAIWRAAFSNVALEGTAADLEDNSLLFAARCETTWDFALDVLGKPSVYDRVLLAPGRARVFSP